MNLSLKDYRNKLRGCWLGKNIGGTLGTPLEATRGLCEVDYYVHDIQNGCLPNDDIDLQLVFLRAAKEHGRKINSNILGEYWLTYITADWSEYGAGKSNLQMGIRPPYSGWYKNHYKDSNGAWIRSEIWACLMPGHPELAVKYAYEDSTVDHSGEGVYAEIFTTAMQSAAFIESNISRLIEIGLSYIPENCGIARAVRYVVASYNENVDWKNVRKGLLQKFPTGFGMQKGYVNCEPEEDIPDFTPGYDAPANVGLAMMALLYGEGDFSRSICIAASCCEDSDCTTGTAGSILGIINGPDCIDEKWTRVVGDSIKTCAIETEHAVFPSSVTELSKEIENLVPVFLQDHYSFDDDGVMTIHTADELTSQDVKVGHFEWINFKDDIMEEPFPYVQENFLYKVLVRVSDCTVENDKPIDVTIKFITNDNVGRPQFVDLSWDIPDEWEITKGRNSSLLLNTRSCDRSTTVAKFTLTPHELSKSVYNTAITLKSNGRFTKMYFPLTFVNI